MVLKCDQCELFFRTEDKLANHKKGLMGLKCQAEEGNMEDGRVDAEQKQISGHTAFVNETLDTNDEEKEEKPDNNDLQNSPKESSNDGVGFDYLISHQVQNNEITSSKEPKADDVVEKEPANDSIMISDAESSEDEAEKEALLEEYSDTVEDATKPDLNRTNSVKTDSRSKHEKPNIEYTLVCVHIETFRVSNDPSISLSQVGCTTALNTGEKEKETFFQPVKPSRLEHFLGNYKMEGDLLKALHMTDENGRFQFRAQFEIKRKEKNKVYAISEKEALGELTKYLDSFENVILFAVDEETLEIILGKLAQFRQEKALPVAGFTTWPKVLEHCQNFAGKNISEEESDLEDFYSQHCGRVAGYITALDVANFLRKSVKKLGAEYARKFGLNNPQKRFSRNDFINEIVEDIDNIRTNTAGKIELNKPLTVEVYSSFRPAVSTTIGIEQMDTIELSSGDESEDSDIDIVGENLKPKNYTKRKSIEDSELISAKRKHPYDFPEYPTSKRPFLNFSGDTIVISSDEEDDEMTLDEEVLPPKTSGFSIPKSLDAMEDLLHRNYTSIRLTKVKEGSWLGKSNSTSSPKCCICNIEFVDSLDLEIHTEKEHMFCKICNLDFSVLSEAIVHSKIHENETKTIIDGLSDDEFSDEEKLDKDLGKDLDKVCKKYDSDSLKSYKYDFDSLKSYKKNTSSNSIFPPTV